MAKVEVRIERHPVLGRPLSEAEVERVQEAARKAKAQKAAR